MTKADREHYVVPAIGGALSSAAPGQPMKILFLQTADQERYRPFWEITSPTVTEYCRRHNFDYEFFLGISRGCRAWQATYNRIPLLQRIVDSGFNGWVCYMDADAFIADLDFDLAGYLADKKSLAFIAATDRPGLCGRPYWLVNAGVFLINLASPAARKIVYNWAERLSAISDQQLQDAVEWSQLVNDQDMLQGILRDLPGAPEFTLTVRGKPNLINYHDGTFIGQILRTNESFQERIERLRLETDRVLGSSRRRSDSDDPIAARLVRALYRVLLLREPEPGGLDGYLRCISDGASIERIMQRMLKSEEFVNNHTRFLQKYISSNPNIPEIEATLTNNLTSLANKFLSDKGTWQGSPPHKYTYLYDLILDRYRSCQVNLLELGLAIGGPEVGGPIDRQIVSPSVQMWLEYFPRAHIYGFDISDFSHMKHPRFTFIRGDASSPEDMDRLGSAAAGFDIIIDDGSHASYHQQLAFKHLYPRLRAGGTYIIEDLHWQSPAYEGKPIPLPKTKDFMVSFFESGKYVENGLLSEDFMRSVRSSVASYAWFPAFDGQGSPAKIFVLRKADEAKWRARGGAEFIHRAGFSDTEHPLGGRMEHAITLAADTDSSMAHSTGVPVDANVDPAARDTPEEIVDLLYRGVLRRAPDEAGRAVHSQLLRAGRSVSEILELFVSCPEFKATKLVPAAQKATTQPRFVPLNAPPMQIQCHAASSQLSLLVNRVSEAWTSLGATRPYHSILTQKDFLPENINEASLDRFWTSGSGACPQVEATLARHRFGKTQLKTCVEYGCGLGRVTFPLARIFKQVHAYDISPTHLKLAEERAAQLGIDNIEFHLCTQETFTDGLQSCDFFFSCIVFQHNPPPLICKLITMALDCLKTDGIAVFQVPTYGFNYRFNIDEYLARPGGAEMEMHVIPQSKVFDLVAAANCQLLEVREDGAIGWFGQWISNTFIVKRDTSHVVGHPET